MKAIDDAEAEAKRSRPSNYSDKDIEVAFNDSCMIYISQGDNEEAEGRAQIIFKENELPRLQGLVRYLDTLLFGEIQTLKARIEELEKENRELRKKLREPIGSKEAP